jgi:predicted DNA-binding WGR domain protein
VHLQGVRAAEAAEEEERARPMIELRRTMPEGHTRTYAMIASSSLFGEHTLTVRHGRLGWKPRVRIETFDTLQKLARRAASLLKARKRHAYVIVQGDPRTLTEPRT